LAGEGGGDEAGAAGTVHNARRHHDRSAAALRALARATLRVQHVVVVPWRGIRAEARRWARGRSHVRTGGIMIVLGVHVDATAVDCGRARRASIRPSAWQEGRRGRRVGTGRQHRAEASHCTVCATGGWQPHVRTACDRVAGDCAARLARSSSPRVVVAKVHSGNLAATPNDRRGIGAADPRADEIERPEHESDLLRGARRHTAAGSGVCLRVAAAGWLETGVHVHARRRLEGRGRGRRVGTGQWEGRW